MPKLVCANCEIELKPETNGVLVIETMRSGHMGLDVAPYKLWHADLWKCPICSAEIVAGFAKSPIAEHFELDFDTTLEREKNEAPRVIYDIERKA